MSATADGAVSRRGFLKLAAAGAAATAIGPTGTAAAFDWESAAIAGGAAAGGPVGALLTHKVAEMQGMTGETVPSGSSTPEAIAESWWRTGMYARQSDDVMLQTFWNRLEDARTIAYLRGKTAALEAMDKGKTQEETMTAAEDAITAYYTIIQTNLLNWWEIQTSKAETAYQEFEQHSEVSDPTKFANFGVDWQANDSADGVKTHAPTGGTSTVSLLDGSEREITTYSSSFDTNASSLSWDLTVGPGATSYSGELMDHVVATVSFDISSPPLSDDVPDQNVNWLRFNIPDDPATYEEAQTAIDQNGLSWDGIRSGNQYLVLWDGTIQQHGLMLDNINAWVGKAYGQVQTGQVDIEQLVANSPMLLASQWSTDYQETGHLAYAAADLATLGLSFDSDNRMVFELDDGTELEGTIYMSESSFEFEVGTTIEPSNEDNGEFYVAADATTMQRELLSEEYRSGIDGGELKLEVTPIEDTEYLVSTTAGEEVSVMADAFSIDENDASNDDVEMIENAESVVVDLSDDLETPITEVESILHLQAGDNEAMVMQLTEPFTILEAYDVESGDEVDVVSGEGYNAGTSSVDLSWTKDYLEMRDNTDDYASASSGGGGGISFPGLGNIGIPGSGLGLIGSALQLAILAAAAYLGYDVFLSDDS